MVFTRTNIQFTILKLSSSIRIAINPCSGGIQRPWSWFISSTKSTSNFAPIGLLFKPSLLLNYGEFAIIKIGIMYLFPNAKRTFVQFSLSAMSDGYTCIKATQIGVYSASKKPKIRKDGQRHASKSVFSIYFFNFFSNPLNCFVCIFFGCCFSCSNCPNWFICNYSFFYFFIR